MTENFLSPDTSVDGRPKRFGLFSRSSSGKKKSKTCDATQFRMQMEVTDLRKRIHILDGDTGRDELLDLLQEKEDQINQKEEQIQRKDKLLRDLNDKFHRANKQLEFIETERNALRSCTDHLEKEKKDIQQMLDMREKEVLSLVRRCSAQDNRPKEIAAMRTSNTELVKKVQDLKSKMAQYDDAIVDTVALQRELTETLEEKDELQTQVNRLKKDHEALTDTLNSSFANIEKLTKAQVEKDEDRFREKQRAQLELEKQRLEHVQEINQMKEGAMENQERFKQLEDKVLQHILKRTTLQQESDQSNKRYEEKIVILKERNDNEQLKLMSRHEEQLQSQQRVHAGIGERMQSDIEAKDRVVSTLENEISKCMEKMMTLSSDMLEIQDNNGERPKLAMAIERLEHERSTLREQLSDKEAEVIELTAALCHFESDNILLRQETKNAGDRLQELEVEQQRIKELEEHLRKTEQNLATEQNKRVCIEKENQSTIRKLQCHFEGERQIWSSVEDGLEKKVSTLETEKKEIQEKFGSSTNEHLSTVHSLEETLVATDDELQNYEAQIATLQATLEDRDRKNQEEIENLRRSLQNAETQVEFKEGDIQHLKQHELKNLEDATTSLRSEIERLQANLTTNEMEAAEITSDFEGQVEQLQSKLTYFENTLSDDRHQHARVVNRLEQELAGLHNDKNATEVDTKFQLAKLQERHAAITSLTKKNSLMEQRERTLRVELELLVAAEEKNRLSYLSREAAFERGIDRERTNRDDDDLRFQEQQAHYENNLSDVQTRVEAQKLKVSEVEEVLEERTKLLGDMVSHNKTIEADLEANRNRAIDLQEEVDNIKNGTENKDDELDRLRASLHSREEEFMEDIHRERHLRKLAESDLQKAHLMVNEAKRDTKDLTELEKENNELKDKVRRQEAYLKRKLQKEKISRDRTSGGSTKKVLTTPSQNPTRKAFGHLSMNQPGSTRTIAESSPYQTPSQKTNRKVFGNCTILESSPHQNEENIF